MALRHHCTCLPPSRPCAPGLLPHQSHLGGQDPAPAATAYLAASGGGGGGGRGSRLWRGSSCGCRSSRRGGGRQRHGKAAGRLSRSRRDRRRGVCAGVSRFPPRLCADSAVRGPARPLQGPAALPAAGELLLVEAPSPPLPAGMPRDACNSREQQQQPAWFLCDALPVQL
jgi:hypothetical protein